MGPWAGGGKKGQLNSLRKGIHPKDGTSIPMPISEAIMSLDTADAATDEQRAEVAGKAAKYSAKDKAVARRNAAQPKAALTAEKRQWVDLKRFEAETRRAAKQAYAV